MASGQWPGQEIPHQGVRPLYTQQYTGSSLYCASYTVHIVKCILCTVSVCTVYGLKFQCTSVNSLCVYHIHLLFHHCVLQAKYRYPILHSIHLQHKKMPYFIVYQYLLHFYYYYYYYYNQYVFLLHSINMYHIHNHVACTFIGRKITSNDTETSAEQLLLL